MEHIFRQKDVRDHPFTMNELNNTLDNLHDSIPREDGTHNAMLQNASTTCHTTMLKYFNYARNKGELPVKCNIARIILICKPGKIP